MKFVVVLGAILMTCLGRPIEAQVRVIDDTADVRVAVLNAVLAARTDLLDGSSTVIAGCSLHGGEFFVAARANIDERFRKLLVRPEKMKVPGQCIREDFADSTVNVLFFDEPLNAPPGKLVGTRIGREVVLHLINGPGGLESLRYLVSSEGIISANGSPRDTTSRSVGWRVREFELLQVQLHWADDFRKVVKMYPSMR